MILWHPVSPIFKIKILSGNKDNISNKDSLYYINESLLTLKFQIANIISYLFKILIT